MIYPNPSTGAITIRFNQQIDAIEVTVVNTLNCIVYKEPFENVIDKMINIDLSDLAKGFYFIKLRMEDKEKTVRIILH